MCALLLTVAIPSLRPLPCASTNTDQTFSQCPRASKVQLLFLYLGFALLALASGGIKPCAYPFGADQFVQDTGKGKESFQSYSNWFFFGIYLSVVLSATIVAYVQQNVGWALGFAIPTIIMAISILVYIVGTSFYRYEVPSGSPLKELAKVCVAAFRKRKVTLPDSSALFDPAITLSAQKNMGEKYVHTHQLRLLDKAAVIWDGDLGADGTVLKPWQLCYLYQVEQLKLMIKTLPIMIAAMLHVLTVSQQNSFALLQANTMDRQMFGSFRIPTASTTVFSMLAIMICLPIYDKVVLPFARRVTGTERGITFLQKIGIGNAMNVSAMVGGCKATWST
ncbi:hypothetical protein L7F22_002319 [Adiantum nelumboides]|nr:hypothetical protein [Adiantum nelumboides]